MSTIYERVSERASKRYWKVRHGIVCDDPFPSQQVESLMVVMCEVLEEELEALRKEVRAVGGPVRNFFLDRSSDG